MYLPSLSMRLASRLIAFAKDLFPCTAGLEAPGAAGADAAGAMATGAATAARAAAPALCVPGIVVPTSAAKAGLAGVNARALLRGGAKSLSGVSPGKGVQLAWPRAPLDF